jgi:hypothetical protein
MLSSCGSPADHGAVTVERALLAALHGGCSVPIGAHAEQASNGWQLSGQVTSLDGTRRVTASAAGTCACKLGQDLAEMLVSRGAEDILGEIRQPGVPADPAHTAPCLIRDPARTSLYGAGPVDYALRLRMTEARLAIVEAIVKVSEPSQARRLMDIVLAATDPGQLCRRIAEEWDLNDVQATAVCDLQLRTLTQARRQEFLDELEQVRATCEQLRSQL